MIEPIDPIKCGEFDGLEMPPRAFTSNHFRLEETDDGFSERIVIRIATAADRWFDAGVRQPFGVAHRQVLRTAIAMMDEILGGGGTPAIDRLIERIEDEVGGQGRGHPPSDDATGEDINDERHV